MEGLVLFQYLMKPLDESTKQKKINKKIFIFKEEIYGINFIYMYIY